MILLNSDEKEQETAYKVVTIMQAITEDLDESGKRAWRKMLGTPSKSRAPSKAVQEYDETKDQNKI